MTNAKRGRGARHGVYLCIVAALGFALSGCGTSAAAPSAAAAGAATQSSAATQTSASASSGTTQSSTSTQSSTPTRSATAGNGAPAGSGSPSGTGSPAGSNSPSGSGTPASITVNWTPPTENTDGTTLTNLAGYNIHYGTASHKYTRTISIANPGLASYVVENLTPGTYYFAVAAVNSAGTESPLSSEVRTKVN